MLSDDRLTDVSSSGSGELDVMGDKHDRSILHERSFEAVVEEMMSRVSVDGREDIVKKDDARSLEHEREERSSSVRRSRVSRREEID